MAGATNAQGARRSLLSLSALLMMIILCSLPPNVSCFSTYQSLSFRRVLPSSHSPTARHLVIGRQRSQPPYPSQLSSRSSSSSLSMHMGHSHSHHHHHNHHDSSSSLAIVHIKTMMRKRRRRIALIVFCALATLGPRVLLRKAVRNSDVAAFLLSSLALASFDKVKRETSHIWQKLRSAWREVAKHSPPLSQYVSSSRNGEQDPATRVTLLGVFVNLFLSVGKLGVGLASHSSALIADAGHSLSDLFSDFVTLYTVQIARLPPDDDHPYGHGKFEAIGSLFLALTLLATGVSVGAMSNKNLLAILQGHKQHVALPQPPALVMAALSILSKEWLYRITKRVGDRLNSQVVLANAWHHRTDAYSSVLALISICLAMFVPGLLAADSFAGLLVAGMICMTGADILGESIKQLSDHNPKEVVKRVTELVQEDDQVEAVDRIRARQVGSQAWVDVKLTLTSTTEESQTVVEERIRQQILSDLTTEVVLDAEVRAIPADVKNGQVVVKQGRTVNAEYSEDDIKAQVRVCSLGVTGVASVEAVTVHETHGNTSVDVTIRADADQSSLSDIRQSAAQFRSSLLDLPSISEAKIFLDLNDDAVLLSTDEEVINGSTALMTKDNLQSHNHHEHGAEEEQPNPVVTPI